MPLYSYTTEAGDCQTDRHYAVGTAPSKITVKGRIYWRDFVPSYARTKAKPADHGYWQRSLSCGVPPHQIADAKAVDGQLGVSVDYDHRGRACFTDAAHKRQWLKAHKWVDHDAGYRDPSPGDFVGQQQTFEE